MMRSSALIGSAIAAAGLGVNAADYAPRSLPNLPSYPLGRHRKGKHKRPPLHRNLNHTSKRVRRKHRRARKARP